MRVEKQRRWIWLCIIWWCMILCGCTDSTSVGNENIELKQNNPKEEEIITVTEMPNADEQKITTIPIMDIENETDEKRLDNNTADVEIEKIPISCRIENGTLFFYGDGRLTNEIVSNLLMEIEDDIETQKMVRVVIEEGITGIGAEVFEGCSFIKELEIAGSVKKIGYCAFKNCALESVNMLEGVQYIDVQAFCGCKNLKEVQIPKSTKIISAEAFSGTFWVEEQKKENSLVTVNGILLDATACSVEIKVPEDIIYATFAAFWKTGWVEQQRENNDLVIINGILLDGCNASGDVIIPEGVRYIADGAFMECEQITSVRIPDGVEGIGSMAFYCCSNLNEIELPNSVQWMGTLAFADCISLESIKMPDGIDGIEDGFFSGCSKLKEVELATNTIEYIGGGAFSRCGNLEKIELSKGLSAIGTGAFYGCSKLSDVALPETLMYLGGEAFKYCESITNIEIPQEIERIEGGTFAQTGLSKIQIPETVQYIGEEAFCLCTNLAQIDIPENITTVGYKAFDKTPWLEEQLQENSLFIMGNSLLVVSTSVENVTIPEHVQVIESGAFENCMITKIEIPETVKEIKAAAFAGCSHLIEIKLPKNITILEEGIFEGCTSLVMMELPEKLCEIGDSAFKNCTSMESIVIPKMVKRIGSGAFAGCSNLESVEIPEAVLEVEYSLFEDCVSLITVVIPEGVTRIYHSAFCNCENLVSIAIPNSVVEISSDWVFNRCKKLTIYCNKGSYAEQYAKENEIEYITVNEEFWANGSLLPTTPPSLRDKLQNNPERKIDVGGKECYAVWGENGAYVWRYVEATFDERAYFASGFALDMEEFYSTTEFSWDAIMSTNWHRWFDWESLEVTHVGDDMFLVELYFDSFRSEYYVNGRSNYVMQIEDWIQDKDDDFYLKTNFNDGYAIGIYKDKYDKYSEYWQGYFKTYTDYKLATVDLNGTIIVSDIEEMNSAVGSYSDGLFYYNNSFYDINFNEVISLSRESLGTVDTEYHMPRFENGVCQIVTYKNGKYWTFSIDKSGAIISDIEEFDIL